MRAQHRKHVRGRDWATLRKARRHPRTSVRCKLVVDAPSTVQRRELQAS